MQISPFKIEHYFARYEFNVDYGLCGSDCESMTIEELLAFESGAILQCGDNYTGNSCYDSKPLKFRDFVFQKNNGQCYGHYR